MSKDQYMQSALILGQFVVLRFIVAPAIAYCVYRICETKSIWTAISDMTLILVYYMWIRRGATHKNEPWLSDNARPINLVVAVGLCCAYFLGRLPSMRSIPERVSELFGSSGNSFLISLYFLAPIKEELLYRGFLLNRLCTIVGFWPAAIVSSAIFALGHRNPFSAFLSGIWLSTLYSPTLGGSLVFPIMIHMIQNITSNMLSLPKGFFF